MITVGLAVSTPVGGRPDDLEQSIRLVEQIDAVPAWTSAWVGDSILGLPVYDSTVLLAALAARTSRIRLGVACLATLGLRQPLVVAHQWATLDVLSGGRMTLMASAGNRTGPGHERELAAFGIGFAEKTARFEEGVEFLRAVSADPRIDFAGRFLRITDARLTPAFLQRPLPIWIVANPGPRAAPDRVLRTVGRAARLGDGWLTYNLTPSLLRERIAVLDAELPSPRRAGASAGAGRFEVGLQVNFHLAATREAAETGVRDYWSTRRAPRGLDLDALGEVCALGTADDRAAFIAALVDAGATHVNLFPLSDDRFEQVERATHTLLPLIRGLVPGVELRVLPREHGRTAA